MQVLERDVVVEEATVAPQQNEVRELSLLELGWVGGGTGSFCTDV